MRKWIVTSLECLVCLAVKYTHVSNKSEINRNGILESVSHLFRFTVLII
jgi:hypothetical protein